MNPARKRRIRLVVALSTALLLASGLIYTSFSAATAERIPSQLLASSTPGESYKLGGHVVEGSVQRAGDRLSFEVRDPTGQASLPVTYSGAVPDPFREGREVIVSGQLQNGTFVAERDSLVTKCPSKFTDDKQSES